LCSGPSRTHRLTTGLAGRGRNQAHHRCRRAAIHAARLCEGLSRLDRMVDRKQKAPPKRGQGQLNNSKPLMISIAAAVLPWIPKATALLPPWRKTIAASPIGMIAAASINAAPDKNDPSRDHSGQIKADACRHVSSPRWSSRLPTSSVKSPKAVENLSLCRDFLLSTIARATIGWRQAGATTHPLAPRPLPASLVAEQSRR